MRAPFAVAPAVRVHPHRRSTHRQRHRAQQRQPPVQPAQRVPLRPRGGPGHGGGGLSLDERTVQPLALRPAARSPYPCAQAADPAWLVLLGRPLSRFAPAGRRRVPAPPPRTELPAGAPDEHRRRWPPSRPGQQSVPQRRALRRHSPGRLPAALAGRGLPGTGHRRPWHEQRPLAQRPAGRGARSAAVRVRRCLQPRPCGQAAADRVVRDHLRTARAPHDKTVCRELLK